MSLFAFLDHLADVASAAIMPYFRTSLDVSNKLSVGFDPVTEADRAGEAAMRQLIEAQFPDHGILGEEFGNLRLDAREIWILDPIDGTRSFISGIPVWGTLIGHKKDGKANAGMMCQPFTKERYWGNTKTAFYRDRDGERPLKSRVCRSLSQATLFTTAPDIFNSADETVYKSVADQVKLTRYGMDCYAYCMVARGSADLVIETELEAYDIAALVPIIEGAGGRVTTWQGDNPVDGGSIIASGDPFLHDHVLEIMNGP